MLFNSKLFFNAFEQDSREIFVRLTINGVEYQNDDIFSFNYDSGSFSGEQFAIGSSYSNSIKVTFSNIVQTFSELDKVVAEIGIRRAPFSDIVSNNVPSKVGNAQVGDARVEEFAFTSIKNRANVRVGKAKIGQTYINTWNSSEDIEYSKLGEFYISEHIEMDWNQNTTTLECSDALIFTETKYETNLNYPAKLKDMLKEIGNNVGLIMEPSNYEDLEDIELPKLTGELTNRKALEKLSQFIIGYARIGRKGYLEVKSLNVVDYSISPDSYFSKGLTKNGIRYKVGGITCTIEGEDESFEIHSGSYSGPQITIENNMMTQEMLDNIYTKLQNINYYSYALSWRGNPALETGDLVKVTDLEGNVYTVPNLDYSLEFNGGLNAKSRADTLSQTEIVASNNSPLKRINETVRQIRTKNVQLNKRITDVNDEVVVLNTSIEEADLPGIKISLENLTSIVSSFSLDLQEQANKIDGFDIPGMQEKIQVIEQSIIDLTTSIEGIPDYSTEIVEIASRLDSIDEIIKGTGYKLIELGLGGEVPTSVDYSRKPQANIKNKNVSIVGFLTTIDSNEFLLGSLPIGMHPTETKYFSNLIFPSRLNGIIRIQTDGEIYFEQIQGSTTTTIQTTDIIQLDCRFDTLIKL